MTVATAAFFARTSMLRIAVNSQRSAGRRNGTPKRVRAAAASREPAAIQHLASPSRLSNKEQQAIAQSHVFNIDAIGKSVADRAVHLKPLHQYELAADMYGKAPEHHGNWYVQGKLTRVGGVIVNKARTHVGPIYQSRSAARNAVIEEIHPLGNHDIHLHHTLLEPALDANSGSMYQGGEVLAARPQLMQRLAELEAASHSIAAITNYQRGVSLFAALKFFHEHRQEQDAVRLAARHLILHASNVFGHRHLSEMYRRIFPGNTKSP